MLHIADSIPGLGMEAITQHLGVDPNRPGIITMQNSTVFRYTHPTVFRYTHPTIIVYNIKDLFRRIKTSSA